MKELLTVPAASRRLGLDDRGNRLKRLILAAERRSQRRIAIRLSGKARTTLRITEAALRRHLPELFTGTGLAELERRFAGYLREVDRRIDERAEEACRRVIAPIKRELEERDERVAAMVVDVAERVAKLAEIPPHHEERDPAEKKPDSRT